MAEEEKNETPEQPEAESPGADATPEEPAAEEPAAEEPAAEEPAAEEPESEAATSAEPSEDRPAIDPTAPGSEAEEAGGADVASDGDSAESGGGAAAAGGSDVKSEAAPKDRPPGADLEPIAIETEQELTAEERARREAEAEERARAEAEATAEGTEEPEAPRTPGAEVPADARIQATGKRKSAIARVVLTAGSGEIRVNRRKLDEYFPRAHHQTTALQPLVTAGYESTVDVSVRVHGGGVSGQAGAVRHGIARALTEVDPELRRDLKRRGLLTRDAREKERRKAGLKKARKRPQFSKR